MKAKHISSEVEVTASLTKDQYDNLAKKIKKYFKHTSSQKRLAIRFFKDRVDVRDPLDIRYKWTNNENTLVIKKGALGSQARQETTVELGNNSQLDHFVTLFSLLGYKVGNAIYREMERFENEAVEATLTKAFNKHFIEVESTTAKTRAQALKEVNDFFAKFELKPLSKSEYQKYLRKLDRTVNLIFKLSDYPDIFKTERWKKVFKDTISSQKNPAKKRGLS